MSEVKELGARAVACKGWRLMPGMRDAVTGARLLGGTDKRLHWGHLAGSVAPEEEDVLPDLSDAATLGCLLELVREAWGIGLITAERTDYSESYDNEGGRLEIRRGLEVLFRASGGSRAGRLVAALKAAP